MPFGLGSEVCPLDLNLFILWICTQERCGIRVRPVKDNRGPVRPYDSLYSLRLCPDQVRKSYLDHIEVRHLGRDAGGGGAREVRAVAFDQSLQVALKLALDGHRCGMGPLKACQ